MHSSDKEELALRSEESFNRNPSPYLPKSYQSNDVSISSAASENLDKKYLEMRKRNFSAYKEAESRNKVIFAWGSEKSRANEEYVRKTDLSMLDSRNRRSESPPSFKTQNYRYTTIPSTSGGLMYDFTGNNESFSEPLHKQSNLSRINKLRQIHSTLIDIDSETQPPKKKKNESSMSFYKNCDSVSDYEHRRAKSSEKFNDQLDEVILVKKKLASKNIPCPVKLLINGLVLADDNIRI